MTPPAAPTRTRAEGRRRRAGGGPSRETVERLLDAYDGTPWRDRVHVFGRWRSCPFPAVADHVPATGRILDVGCGHGLLSLHLVLGSAGRRVTGLDIDAGKIAIARRAAARAGLDPASLTFAVAEPGDLPAGEWDAITIVDILYLLGPRGADEMVTAAARALAPGGVLLVKEMALAPRWKYQLTRVQELVATRVVRITEGEHVALVAPDAVAGGMARAGLEVAQHRLDAGRLHPHHLVAGRRPAL